MHNFRYKEKKTGFVSRTTQLISFVNQKKKKNEIN